MNSYWKTIVRKVISEYGTPCYISAWNPIESALNELKVLDGILPVKHWLSFKTHPLAPLVRKWGCLGYGVEVVSEYEFLATLAENISPELILVNGVAKHSWLTKYNVSGIRVHFDSLLEVEKLIEQARRCNWRVGLRCHVSEEYDPDEPIHGGQFGMLAEEMRDALGTLRSRNITPESVHFHLRTNVESPDCYARAIAELSDICTRIGFSPKYVDCGGGLPVRMDQFVVPAPEPNLPWLLNFRDVLNTIPNKFPHAEQIWLENGQFVTARSSVLVVSVLDIKERPDSRYLICDGGRTNHALVSDWEVHNIFSRPQRTGRPRATTVCGPTCMAFDRLLRADLPEDIGIGDNIIWMNAGAYHIPWETRFSHGLAKVVWCNEDGSIFVARRAEEFLHWWGQWEQ